MTKEYNSLQDKPSATSEAWIFFAFDVPLPFILASVGRYNSRTLLTANPLSRYHYTFLSV